MPANDAINNSPLKMIMSLAEQRGTYCAGSAVDVAVSDVFFSEGCRRSRHTPVPPAAGQGHVHARHWPAASRRPTEGV